MKMSRKIFFVSALLLFFVLANASITAWLTDLGTLQHTYCNGTIIKTSTLELVTKEEPKNGTDLARVGWFDGITASACIFYQDKHDSLIYARYNCNLTSGGFEPREQANVSALLPLDVRVRPDTNIAVVLVGEEPEIRVYFHTTELEIHEVSFQDTRGWRHEGKLLRDPSFNNDLAAVVVGKGEIKSPSPPKGADPSPSPSHVSDGRLNFSYKEYLVPIILILVLTAAVTFGSVYCCAKQFRREQANREPGMGLRLRRSRAIRREDGAAYQLRHIQPPNPA